MANLSKFIKRRLNFELDYIKSLILSRSAFKSNLSKYTVNKVDVKSSDILCLRIKYE
jgi:hypothetical protein